MIRKFLLFILFGFVLNNLHAAHLVGGDLTFQCLGNNLYTFKLKVYRDALATAAHDNPAYVFIYNNDNGQLFASRSAAPGTILTVTNNDLGPCLQNPAPPRFDFATYNFSSINLPVNNNGYRVVYQRCCRTNNALNLTLNFDGISQGSTYEVQITRKVMTECNSTATSIPVFEFQTTPPTQLCANEEVLVNQSVNVGILAFADSVTYALCPPYEGGSGTNCIYPDPNVVGSNCSTPDGLCDAPCAYTVVSYSAGYTFQTPMGPLSTVDINRATGQMIVNPSGTGIYVVGICATAYKDGQIWSFNRRDFQFKVFDCIADGASPPIANNGTPLNLNSVNIDTVEIESVYLICNDLNVTFAQTSPQALSYWWDFGVPGVDNDTSILAFPNYTYPDTGTYVVTFIVNANLPCVDTSYGAVKIFPEFSADFVFDAGCYTIPVTFTDSSVSTLQNNQIIDWQWSFGDGTIQNGVQNPSHQYSQAGSFNVTLTAISELGCSDVYTTQIVTEPSPVANFANLLNCTGDSHQFNNSSALNGTSLENFVWDFGNGGGLTFVTTSTNPPPQVYNSPGQYNITLVVNSLSGCSDTITNILSVGESVNANFSYSPTTVCPGQPIQFSNTTVEPFETLEWLIDGNTLTNNSPTFTYSSPGNNQVTLILYSNTICGDTITKNIVVENGPLADFVVDSICTKTNYNFVNLSQDNGFLIDEYLWNFGDGTSGNGFSPSHTYTTSGNYEVVLLVSSDLVICSDSATKTIFVKEEITPDFSFSPDTICEGITNITFTNLTSGGSWDSVEWDFGNDTLSSINNPTYAYSAYGIYDVTLTIYDNVCSDLNINKPIEVLEIPQPKLPDTVNICDGVKLPLYAVGSAGYNIIWSTGETTQTIFIDNSIDSIIVIVDNEGCITSDTTYIKKDCPAYIPNTFTPNNDGVNDLFLPLPYNITSFTMKIFDRWGDKIFETSSFNMAWNGDYVDGAKAPLDTYSYILEGVGLDEKPLFQFGIINLIR